MINPATEEVISEVPKGSVDNVRKAIDAAEQAPKGWAKLPAISIPQN